MKIGKIIITEKERNEAIEQWLTKRGIAVKVNDITKNYSASGGFEVNRQVGEPEPAAPPEGEIPFTKLA